MNLIEVKNKKTRKQFLNLPKRLYKDDKNWVCPLDIEIERIFNKDKNNSFINGDACRWILIDDNALIIGRIAAFYNTSKANLPSNGQPTGGIGFFECIHNQQAANYLFNTAKAWLISKGMEAMDGPINFGENYINWGLLSKGYLQQAYGMPYHFQYYKSLFENFGFKPYYDQYSYHVDLTKELPKRQESFARYIMRKPNLKFEHFKFKNYKKYLTDAVEIYNTVWKNFHDDYTPLNYNDFEKSFIAAKPLLKEDFIVFAYDYEKPIGMIICFPDLNQVFKKLKNGRLHMVNKLKLFYHKNNSITRARQLISGVIPEYQRSGIIAPMFIKMVDACKRNGITELEMGWIGDYNKTVNKMYKQMENAKEGKTHTTYRYLFDRSKTFERFTNNPKA